MDMHDIVFLFDVDNTLLDNDHVESDIKAYLTQNFGAAERDNYWRHLEELRSELSYVDYLGALERFRLEMMHRPEVLRMSNWLIDYPFIERAYPGAFDAVKYAERFGRAIILSDGDAVFQPRKIARSGLWDLFEGRVLIYVHKEQELEDIERLYPARHYILVDDKVRILSTIKRIWAEKVTTVYVKQGHYARELEGRAISPPPDVEIAQIGDLMNVNFLTSLETEKARASREG